MYSIYTRVSARMYVPQSLLNNLRKLNIYVVCTYSTHVCVCVQHVIVSKTASFTDMNFPSRQSYNVKDNNFFHFNSNEKILATLSPTLYENSFVFKNDLHTFSLSLKLQAMAQS